MIWFKCRFRLREINCYYSYWEGGKITSNFGRDIINLIAKKSKEYYDALINDGYAMVGDNYIAIELKKQLNINKIDYFVLTNLSVEFFIINLKGACKLGKILTSMYKRTKRTKIISMQLIPVIEYFVEEGGDWEWLISYENKHKNN